MTDSTVADQPFGSIASFADIIRRTVRRPENVHSAALGIVQMIAEEPSFTDAMKVKRIRNIIAASDLVDQELMEDLAGPTGLVYAANQHRQRTDEQLADDVRAIS